jgi:hypothetical protein
MKRVLKIIIAPAGIWIWSGCGVAAQGGDGLTIAGSPEGISAFSDLLAGTAVNAKAEPVDTPYFQMRRLQVMPIKKRPAK